jgi:hypothetical protein
MPRQSPPRVFRGRAERELVQVGAADEYRAGIREARDDRGIPFRDAAFAQP